MANKPPPHISHAAKLAAVRVQEMLIEMLMDGQVGEVAVVVDWGHLTPQKRVTTKAKGVKVARGTFTSVETVE